MTVAAGPGGGSHGLARRRTGGLLFTKPGSCQPGPSLSGDFEAGLARPRRSYSHESVAAARPDCGASRRTPGGPAAPAACQ